MSAAIPTETRTSIAIVESWSCGISFIFPIVATAATVKKSASPAGKAFIKTFFKKSPLIMLLLGCNAKKNAGIPIVNAPKSESCVGYKGYLLRVIIENNAISIEKIFFTRNSEAAL